MILKGLYGLILSEPPVKVYTLLTIEVFLRCKAINFQLEKIKGYLNYGLWIFSWYVLSP